MHLHPHRLHAGTGFSLQFHRYRTVEVIHARWAMLGALGILLPEILEKYAGIEFGVSMLCQSLPLFAPALPLQVAQR